MSYLVLVILNFTWLELYLVRVVVNFTWLELYLVRVVVNFSWLELYLGRGRTICFVVESDNILWGSGEKVLHTH